MAVFPTLFLAFAFAFGFSLLFCNFTPSYGTATDIYCLKSFKDSVEDPFGYLKSSWNFDNQTEGSICRFNGVECWHQDENKVLNLRLSAMRLRGKFPLGLANCSSLTGLNLSSNEFYGPIPSSISQLLHFVTSLDLSSNEFSGEIPASISNCSYLNVVKLDNNRLTGHIPPQLVKLTRLKVFSVANNPELCGSPLGPCKDKPRKKSHASSLRFSGFIVGYAISFLVAVVFCNVPALTRRGKKAPAQTVRARMTESPVIEQLRLFPSSLSSGSNNIKISELEKFVTRMSLAEIKRATVDFGKDGVNRVGKTGTMHKATLPLPNGWFLAVKKLYHNPHFNEQFVIEVMVLGRLRHPNLVPLLGFCVEAKERLLVYAYMPNHNLHYWLHRPDQGQSSDNILLDWPLRLRIAIRVARALTWLHNNPFFLVLHLNISSKCILLDHYFKPRISSFGSCKMRNIRDVDLSINFNPNAELTACASATKDVHDYGMVLLEMITGNEKFMSMNSCESLLSYSSNSSLYDAIDKSLVGRGFDGEIYELFRIACDCVDTSPGHQPTMLQVFESVTSIGKHSETWVASEAGGSGISMTSDRVGEIEVIDYEKVHYT